MTRRARRTGRSFPPVTLDAGAIVAHAPYVRALLRAMGVHEADVEDLVQEVTAGAWTGMLAGRFRPDPAAPREAAIRAWLSGITRNQVGHHRQRASRREIPFGDAGCLEEVAPVILHVPAPDGPYAAREILRALMRIPWSLRIVLVLHFLEGFDGVEIAAILEIPEGTAYNRIRLGCAHFLRAVQRWRRPRS